MIRAFVEYRDKGVPPGDFVRACLENKLCEAFLHADDTNVKAMPHIVAWLYWSMPSNIWKSREAVNAHLTEMREELAVPERDEAPTFDVSQRWDGGLHNRPGTEHNPEG